MSKYVPTHLRLLLTVLVLLLVVPLAQAQKRYASCTVKVMIANTDTPIDYAHVWLSQPGETTREGYTDATGRVTISNVVVGSTVDVNATRKDMETGTVHIPSWPGNTVIGVYCTPIK